MFDFSRQLCPNEALVCLAGTAGERPAFALQQAIAVAAERFGFTFRACTDSYDLKCDRRFLVRHLIVLASGPFSTRTVGWAAERISVFDTASLAFRYASMNEMLFARPSIEICKAQFQGRINFLRPDIRSEDGTLEVSQMKIVDNAVCDSVRVKYQAGRIKADAIWPRLAPEEKEFFAQASCVYRDYSMYHRAPTDGFFALRRGDGYAITSTKSDKTRLNPTQISLVHSYDRASRNLVFEGQYLPSSDSVEAATVFDLHPDVQAIIHTHASDRFTRNPAYEDRILVPRMPYGEPDLGMAISSHLSSTRDGFLIIEEHGEVFARVGTPRHLIGMVRGLCESSCRGV